MKSFTLAVRFIVKAIEFALPCYICLPCETQRAFKNSEMGPGMQNFGSDLGIIPPDDPCKLNSSYE